MQSLIYVMDPMCSWCWAFAPELEAFRSRHPELPLQHVMGGLAQDSDAPMPGAMQQQIQAIWRQIESRTGTRFNHDFWRLNSPRRSTWEACRAVIAAGRLAPGAEITMIAGIQHAYYLEARNPSEREVLVAIAGEQGLDTERLRELLQDGETEKQLQRHFALRDSLGAQGFPTLLLQRDDELFVLSSGYSTAQQLRLRYEQLFRK
ncbi:DsbA family protein [Marinobacterium nitratireducens]|uniref:DsbA family protein n=1 Tax=Marinobacterium nitratireducens TaxID=518897 RepID=A0A917ZFG4_9GAMM|nr:DsbA family protein [Marinobacterium nitratireducens]GGO82146.1 DsbA family protein [Marinobacterium nitratireducens]